MEEKLEDNLILEGEKIPDGKMIKIYELKNLITLKNPVSSIYLQIYRIIILIIFLSHFFTLVYDLKMEIFEFITKNYSIWTYILTIINLIFFLLKTEKKISFKNSDYFHLTLVTNFLIVCVFWINFPFINFSDLNLTYYEKFNFFYLHSFPFLTILVDFFLNKIFFLYTLNSILNLLGLFIIYFFVNLFYVKVFNDPPRFSFHWDSIYEFIAVLGIFCLNIIFWYFFLWIQKLKFSIKKEFKKSKKLRSNFIF